MKKHFTFSLILVLTSLILGCASPVGFKTKTENYDPVSPINDRMFILVQPSRLGDINLTEVDALQTALGAQLKNGFKQQGLDPEIKVEYLYEFEKRPFQQRADAALDACQKSKMRYCLWLHVGAFGVKITREGVGGRTDENGDISWRAKLIRITNASIGTTTTTRRSEIWAAESNVMDFSRDNYSKDKYVGSATALSNQLVQHMQKDGLIGKSKP
jgi:hypothetical protein